MNSDGIWNFWTAFLENLFLTLPPNCSGIKHSKNAGECSDNSINISDNSINIRDSMNINKENDENNNQIVLTPEDQVMTKLYKF